MTVNATATFVEYPGNGVATVFTFPFLIQAASEIVVGFVVGGVYAVQTTGFTVAGVNISGGGTVTFTTAPPTGTTVDLRSAMPETQPTNFANLGAYDPESTTNAVDRAVRLVQDLYRLAYAFGIHGPDSESTPWPALPPASQRLGMGLVFDSVYGLPALGALTTVPVTQALIASLIGQTQTPAEAVANVTPVNTNYPELDARRYGVDTTGATDSTTAFANLLAVASQYLSAGVLLPVNSNIRLDGGFTIDTNRVHLDGNGASLDFSHMTTGYAVQFTNSETNVNARVMRNSAHPLENMRWLGPGCAVTAVTAEYVNDANSATYQFGGIKVQNVTFQDFATDVYLGNGANFVAHIACNFTQTYGATGTTYSVIAPAAPQNAGERNCFIDCAWFNKALLILNQATTFGDIFCQNCSFDYFTNAINVTGGAGIVTCHGCHFEANTDLSQWGIVTGASSQIMIQGCTLSCTGNRTTWDLFWSDSTCTNGGITIRDCFVGTGANTFTTRLVGSTGAARVENVVLQYYGSRFAFSAAVNTLAYGGFESANYAAEWTLTAGANQSTTQAHTGTHSCQLPGTNSQNPNAVATVPCKPNQYAVGEFWFYSPLMTTGAFNGTLSYLDKGGNVLLALTVMAWTNANPPPNANTWTKRGFGTVSPAPPGTVSASIDFQITGTSTNLTGYIDDVILNVG